MKWPTVVSSQVFKTFKVTDFTVSMRLLQGLTPLPVQLFFLVSAQNFPCCNLSVASCPTALHLWEESGCISVIPSVGSWRQQWGPVLPSITETEQANFPSLFSCCVLQSLTVLVTLCWIQSNFFVLWYPKLDTVLQIRPHKYWIGVSNCFFLTLWLLSCYCSSACSCTFATRATTKIAWSSSA